MKICEVNFNAPVFHGKGEPPLATYVTPPRANKLQSAASVSSKFSSKPGIENFNAAVCASLPSLSSYPYLPVADSRRLLETADANYAQCPCVTCAQYRAYYAMHSLEATQQRQQEESAPTAMTATTQKCDTAPVMVTRTAAQVDVYGQQQQQQQEQGQERSLKQHWKAATISASPIDCGVMMSVDTACGFERKCVGRIAELACTAEGRSMLLMYMRSQDAHVINTMVNEIIAGVETVALDNHGCHVLRALCDYMNAEQIALLVSSFNETLVLNLCTASQYTRRVLQFLFERPLINLQPIVNVLAANAQYLAATQQGCISLMRVFEQCDAKQKAQLMAPLIPLFTHIAQDPFGNYVVQCAIEYSGKTVAAQYVVSCFAGELLNMSCNKYASNAVEKIIKVCGDVPAVRRLLTDELIFNPAALLQMVQDNFGNFVVQSIIEHTSNQIELKKICDRLRPALLNSPYAAKIEAKIRAKYTSPTNNNNNNSNNNNKYNNNCYYRQGQSRHNKPRL